MRSRVATAWTLALLTVRAAMLCAGAASRCLTSHRLTSSRSRYDARPGWAGTECIGRKLSRQPVSANANYTCGGLLKSTYYSCEVYIGGVNSFEAVSHCPCLRNPICSKISHRVTRKRPETLQLPL